MRISIWQQFSSNHSGGFELVGVFEDSEHATNAGQTLIEILKTIADTRVIEHTEREGTLTVAERTYAEQYGIDWSRYSINWIVPKGDGVLNVVTLDNYVFVSNVFVDNTWMGIEPLDAIMTKLGGETLISESVGKYAWKSIVFDLWCQTPNEDVTKSILEAISPYLQQVRAEKMPPAPWAKFVDPKVQEGYGIDGIAYYGHVERDGYGLHFRNLTFGPTFAYDFMALMAFLKDKGCSAIRFSVQARDMDDVFETR